MMLIHIGHKRTYYKENTEAFVVASKEIGLEVNAYKTKYMVMSRDQNARRSHNVENDSSFFERMESSDIWEQP